MPASSQAEIGSAYDRSVAQALLPVHAGSAISPIHRQELPVLPHSDAAN